jgi:hypothetical protein
LQGKADVNTVAVNNRTPLYIAALNGQDTCVRVLLEGKANVNAVDLSNKTPLYIAARKGHDTCVRVLLEANADVNVVNARGETLLFDLLLIPDSVSHTRGLSTRSRIRTATLLLEHDIDLSLQDEHGTTIVEAIRRPVCQPSVAVQQSPVWQLILGSERARCSEELF